MTAPRAVSGRAEAGSASVVLLGVAVGALALVGSTAAVLRLQVDVVRAGTTADAASVAAAASTVGLVAERPCAAADRAARANGAAVERCTVDGAMATVRVVLRSGPLVVRGASRAGPDTAPRAAHDRRAVASGAGPDTAPRAADGPGAPAAAARPGPAAARSDRVRGADADAGVLGLRVCMVCLSVRHSSTSTVVTSALCARRPDSTTDQGVTCQARRSS